jgi:hypothetical protein
MPRDPLAWLPLLQHLMRCLGEGGHPIARLGDLGALPDLGRAWKTQPVCAKMTL